MQSNEISTNRIQFTQLESPLGLLITCASENGICLLEFTDRKMLKTEFKIIQKRFNAILEEGENKYFEILKVQLGEYFRNERKEFSVPLHTQGTPFQERVWKELLKIPYGETRSYKTQATALGSPASVRAVANANGMNMIAIIIPCHRVIGEDGHLTGYGGGLWRKKWLLDLESDKLKSQQEIPFVGLKNYYDLPFNL